MAGSFPYGRWNFTERGLDTVYDDKFQGRGNHEYTTYTAKSNQGYRNLISTFPQGSMSSCRYPKGARCNRPMELNNWHDRKHEWDLSKGVQAMAQQRVFVEQEPPVVTPMTQTKPAVVPRQHDIEDVERHHQTRLRPGEMYRASREAVGTQKDTLFWSERQRGWIREEHNDALAEHVRTVSR